MPVIEPCRKIPFAQNDKLKAELQRMEAMWVIQNIVEPTEWVNSLVPITKPNEEMKLQLNLQIPRYLQN